MTPPASSTHPSGARSASTRFASETLSGLANLGVDVVVIGGWAVRLYGSPVFSIDLDILMTPWGSGDYEIYDFIHARTDHHKSAYEDSYLEAKDFDEPNRLWITGESFVPGTLIEHFGREHRTADVDGHPFEADVPTPPVLAFMKLKALLNRSNKLHALRDPTRLVSLDEESREQIEGITPAFMVRKIAKDIVDLAYLFENHTDPKAVLEAIDYAELETPLGRLTSHVTDDLFDEATKISIEHGLKFDCKARVQALFDVLLRE